MLVKLAPQRSCQYQVSYPRLAPYSGLASYSVGASNTVYLVAAGGVVFCCATVGLVGAI